MERREHDLRSVAAVEADPHPVGQVVKRRDRRLEVQLGPVVGGDAERPDGEVDLGLRACDEPREPRPVRRPRDVDPTHRRSVRPVESWPGRAAVAAARYHCRRWYGGFRLGIQDEASRPAMVAGASAGLG